MSTSPEKTLPAPLDEQLRDALCVTAGLLLRIQETCRRLPATIANARAARVDKLIQSQAWTDAALALIDLELPQWQLRRLAYDQGEWHCALSRQRELPDWLDQSIEARHADPALAIMSAFVEARRIGAPPGRASVPEVRQNAQPSYEPVSCDNFA